MNIEQITTPYELIESYLLDSGSTWVAEDNLVKYSRRMRFPLEVFNLKNDKFIRKRKLRSGIYEFTTNRFLDMEFSIAKNVIRIMQTYYTPQISRFELDVHIASAEKQIGICLHDQQKLAVIGAIRNGVFIITGGPGTGKTCTLQSIEYVLKRIDPFIDIRYTAPTGKAARRISESTGNSAKTIQKELGITPENTRPKFYGGDVLIVDEVSMLDCETAYMVFRAIQNGQKIILVGDIDQLPSVGPGAILRDLIWSSVVPTVRLTKTFRQANDSTLFDNIQKVKKGEWQFKNGTDFQISHITKETNVITLLTELYLQEVTTYGLKNVACLLPYRKAGTLCSDYMNNVIQSKVNPTDGKPCLKGHTEQGYEIKFTVGDPVMQLENRAECANGDIGYVTEITDHDMTVIYQDATGEILVIYDKYSLDQLSLAYAMSINKSQGSEYKSVIMGVTMAHKQMLNRNLVYTGITRAKKKCVCVQEDAAMQLAVGNEITLDRVTLLQKFLRNEYAAIDDTFIA